MKQQTNLTLKQLLSTHEAAIEIGCSPNTLKQSRMSGELFGKQAPAFEKRGKKVLYRKETLEKFNSQFAEQANTAAA